MERVIRFGVDGYATYRDYIKLRDSHSIGEYIGSPMGAKLVEVVFRAVRPDQPNLFGLTERAKQRLKELQDVGQG